MIYIFGYIIIFIFLVYVIFSLYQKNWTLNFTNIYNRLKFNDRFLPHLFILFVISLIIFIFGIIFILPLNRVYVINYIEFLKFSFYISFPFIFVYTLLTIFIVRISKVSMIIVLLNNIGIFLFVYTLLNHINYKYDTSQAVSYNLKISKIFQVGKVKLKTYHIIVDKYKDEKNKNFIVPYKIYKSLNKFDNITIEVKNGYFGFEYIDIIIKDNKRIDTLLNK